MADDLDDQWYLNDQTEGDDKFERVEVSLPADQKRGFKRKFRDVDRTSKINKSSEKLKVKKKKEKKKISNESDEVLSKSGEPEDVKQMMTKELKERLSADTLEDFLPDIDSDFFEGNVKSAPPSEYLKAILPKWREVVKKSLHMRKTGCPCVLIVTSSAIRAVELNRAIKEFCGDKSKVAKLFSKHMKVEEQKKYLTKTNCQIGIGTPNRLLLLIKQGVLQLESLVAIILDWNWRDSKLKRMCDIPEIRHDLTLLLKDYLIETVHGSPCKIALL